MDDGLFKEQYRIGEVSRLFGIGQDSLRYYERLGIVVPKREVNGYRAYDLDDMFTLSLIKDLRLLGFSMQQIKTYLDDRTLESTGRLLSEEAALIDRQIERLLQERHNHDETEEAVDHRRDTAQQFDNGLQHVAHPVRGNF